MRAGKQVIVVAVAALSLQGCITFAGIPQKPAASNTLEQALRRAHDAGWAARVTTEESESTIGRVIDLTADSVNIGGTALAAADITSVELRSDASPLLLAGGAAGFLAGYALAGLVTLVVGIPYGLATFGVVTLGGIAIAARAARRRTESDWHLVWSREPIENDGRWP